MSLYFVVILSALFAASSGNIFSTFSPLSALRSFSPFQSFPSFGSSFSNFPFGQPYASSYSSNDPFNSAFTLASSPFQNSYSPSPAPQAVSPFGGGFSSGAFPYSPFPSFPPMPSFPSFNSFTDGLKGNGFKVTSTSSEGKDGSQGQVTVQVQKIDENKPGEQRQVIQTFRTAGPLIPSNQAKGKVQNKADRHRVVNRPPMKTNNQKGPLPNGAVNQQRKPSFAKPMKPASPTKVSPLNDLSLNGTAAPQQQSIVSTSNKATLQEKNNNQLIKNNGATVSSSKTSSSLSIPSTSQNIVHENGSSFSSGNSKVISNTNSQAKSFNGVTVKRVDSSGRITTGFIQP
ncbi:uncharacterized protein LOC107368519 [Tetranychus urticae]|uniref:Uncharacterized protein n=1 Tax=Tetranychus urticae TaxID=32264 RepID=T1KZ03_TETUR|nr:uncharacterized protein LOC107368519 [Tetranychus urticae]